MLTIRKSLTKAYLLSIPNPKRALDAALALSPFSKNKSSPPPPNPKSSFKTPNTPVLESGIELLIAAPYRTIGTRLAPRSIPGAVRWCCRPTAVVPMLWMRAHAADPPYVHHRLPDPDRTIRHPHVAYDLPIHDAHTGLIQPIARIRSQMVLKPRTTLRPIGQTHHIHDLVQLVRFCCSDLHQVLLLGLPLKHKDTKSLPFPKVSWCLGVLVAEGVYPLSQRHRIVHRPGNLLKSVLLIDSARRQIVFHRRHRGKAHPPSLELI